MLKSWTHQFSVGTKVAGQSSLPVKGTRRHINILKLM